MRLSRTAPSLALVLLAFVGTSARADAGIEDLRLRMQPLVPTGAATWTPEEVGAVAHQASNWVGAASQGRTKIVSIEMRPTVTVPGASCRDLARAVALAGERRAAARGDLWVYLGDAEDCPYLGLAETPGSWVVIASPGVSLDAVARTLVHEVGHSLGLSHAGALTCPIMQDAQEASHGDCTVDEYGDRTDPLGRATLDWGLSALNLQRLGWGDGLVDIAGEGSHRLSLLPVAAPGPDAIRVVDPVGGDTYLISYRAPSGPDRLDRSILADERGVYIHRLPTTGEDGVGSVLLPWTHRLTRPDGGKPGYSYVASSGGISVSVVSLGVRNAKVEVLLDKGGRLKDASGPVFMSEAFARRDKDGSATVTFGRAVDQSGLAAYEVIVRGRVVTRVTPSAGVGAYSVKMARVIDLAERARVRAIDARGNFTDVIVKIPRRGRADHS